MRSLLERLAANPYPLRSIALRILRHFNVADYNSRLSYGLLPRPPYGYCVFHGASLAKKLGYDRISVLEFGVAGGRGLVDLEYHAREVSRELGIEIDVYGFDTGIGLPAPLDYRDLPYHWQQGFFESDLPKLRARLNGAHLIIGDIRETSRNFFADYNPAPVAAVMHDLDFYSSTAAALAMFDAPEKYFLPRVFCFFDDVIGSETELYNDFTGERLAINEFNQTHETKKLAAPYHFLTHRVRETWHSQIFIYHDFRHSRYNDFISNGNQHLPLP
jgi:hypothetical protein